MIKIYKEELLKNTIDYEEYSENVCKLTLEELKKEGLLECGGCCLKGENKKVIAQAAIVRTVVKNNIIF